MTVLVPLPAEHPTGVAGIGFITDCGEVPPLLINVSEHSKSGPFARIGDLLPVEIPMLPIEASIPDILTHLRPETTHLCTFKIAQPTTEIHTSALYGAKCVLSKL